MKINSNFIKKSIFFLIFFLLLIILRESIFNNLNYYDSSQNSKASFNYQENSKIIETYNDTNLKNDNFQDIGYILISGKDTLANVKGKGNPIVWKIKKLSFDKGLFPLFKKINYETQIECESDFSIVKIINSKIKLIKATVSGKLNIEGNNEIVGFCSISENKKLIENEIIQIVNQKNKLLVVSLDKKYSN